MSEKIKSDVLCKRALRQKGIVAYILKHCLKEYENQSYEEVLGSLSENNESEGIHLLNSEDISKEDAKLFYDLLSSVKTDEEKILINLEPQGTCHSMRSLVNRMLYTSSRMIVWQRNEPEGFQGSDFENLNKTVSIWIVFNPPAKLAGKRFFINDQIDADFPVDEDCNMRRIILMFLHKEIDVTDKSALMMLSILFDDRISDKERLFLLKEEYGIVLAKEDEEMMSEWHNTADAFIERGYERGDAAGYERGNAAGYERGNAEGYERGSAEGVEKVARQMLHKGISDEMIAEMCGLSYEKIEELKNEEMQHEEQS